MEEKQRNCGVNPRLGKKGAKVVKAQTFVEVAKRSEAVKETLRQKLELERRALHIVERLLEDSVTEDFLIDCARFITPANYKDAVEERFIVKICGYPVCPSKLKNVPKQQYKISTRTNKVYDITERKCFCSNFCYRASKYFEVQIPKTPLWLREDERPPEVKLLKEGVSGSSGEEVVISSRSICEEEIDNPALEEPACAGSGSESSEPESDFISSVVSRPQERPPEHKGAMACRVAKERSGAKITFADEDRMGEKSKQIGSKEEKDCSTPCDVLADRLDQHAVGEAVALLTRCRMDDGDATAVVAPQRDEGLPQLAVNSHSAPSKLDSVPDITQVGMSTKGAAELRSLLSSQMPKGCSQGEGPGCSIRTSLLESLTRTLREWRTEETLKFLYGLGYTPGPAVSLVREKEKDEDELDEDDLEESVEGPGMVVTPVSEQDKPSAPAPDYGTLRREAETLNLRVQEFYRGGCILPEEVELGPGVKGGDTGHNNCKDPALPLVDSHAQHGIQKRIVAEKLNRSLRNIVGPLSLTMNDVSTELNNLVRTFRFTNSNIIHKSPEWNLIAVVLLLVLSEVSMVLKESLASPSSAEYLSTLIRELRLKDQDLQSLLQLFQRPAV